MILFVFIPYPSSPSYETINGYYSTGLYITDLDKNNKKDIIVSNGNDMERERNYILYNGSFYLPNWFSSDSQYFGHLSVGDVNGDGFLDLVVAGFSGYYENWKKQVNVLYINNNGILNNFPSWVSDSVRCFGVAHGDVNGDGLSDFAFFCGNDYNNSPEEVKIYLSNGYILNNFPYWKSDSIYSLGGKFFDVDNDGDLDLFVGVYNNKCRLYKNNNGILESNPSWISNVICKANQVSVGDINKDGYLDVVVANMGNVLIFYNNNGTLNPNPFIISNVGNYTSAVSLGDLNNDGYLDLAVGGWWDPLLIFENINGTFNSPSWIFNIGNALVSEYIFFSDLDNAYLIDTFETFLVPTNNYHVFVLKHKPIDKILAVFVNGNLIASNYVYNEEDGWISIKKQILAPMDSVKIFYRYSKSIDMVITNWEKSRGNFIFLNQNSSIKETKLNNQKVIYDILGRKINKLKKGINFIIDEKGNKRIVIVD